MGFDSIAEFYPLLFDEQVRLAREGPLLLEIVQQYKPLVRVLDLGCGSGVHSRFLAKQGCDVTAVDLSVEMLQYAKRQQIERNINYIVADFVNLPIRGKWDFILCLGNSLCLIPHRDDVQEFFFQIKSLLTDTGIFILQILNYNHSDLKQLQTKSVTKELRGNKVTVIKTLAPGKDVFFLSINYFAEIQGIYKTASETNILHKFSLYELSSIAEGNGLSVSSVYGDFQKSDFNANMSRDLIVTFSNS